MIKATLVKIIFMLDQFSLVTIDTKLTEMAKIHAEKRTAEIVRQFVPQNAPLSAVESNFVGALGEIGVKKFLGLNTILEDNYHQHKIDDGDLVFKDLVYDVKTDAIPKQFYDKLYGGAIKNYDLYGCRVFTSKHLHHLKKYTGGLIFAAFEIPNDAKQNKIEGVIRESIYQNNKILIIGYIRSENVYSKEPTWYTPMNPITKKQSQYNSPNYIFHHSELKSINGLI